MNQLLILKSKGADIDQRVLRAEFQDYIPMRLEDAMEKDPGGLLRGREVWRVYDSLDTIDYHYRRYLKGTLKTLHRITYAFRLLPKSHVFEAMHICERIYQVALKYEFYELCTRHHSAKKKLLKLIQQLHAK